MREPSKAYLVVNSGRPNVNNPGTKQILKTNFIPIEKKIAHTAERSLFMYYPRAKWTSNPKFTIFLSCRNLSSRFCFSTVYLQKVTHNAKFKMQMFRRTFAVFSAAASIFIVKLVFVSEKAIKIFAFRLALRDELAGIRETQTDNYNWFRRFRQRNPWK